MRTLTNARLYHKNQPDEPPNGMMMMMMRIHCYCFALLWPFCILYLSSLDINTTCLSSLLSFIGFSETPNVETYWSHWMNFTESLLWLDTNIR